MARPTKYNQTNHSLVMVFARLGYSNQQIAELIGVSEATVYAWLQKYPQFMEDLKKAKESACDMVEAALFKRAVGYDVEEKRVFLDRETGEVKEGEQTKHIPGDVGAAKFILTNMRPKDWKEKTSVDMNVTTSVTDLLESSESQKIIDVTPTELELEGDTID